MKQFVAMTFSIMVMWLDFVMLIPVVKETTSNDMFDHITVGERKAPHIFSWIAR